MSALLELRLTGGASNSDPELSLGGDSSSVALSLTPMNNLFKDVTPSMRENGGYTFRALSINNSGDTTAGVIKAYMSTETSNADTHIEFGLDSTTQSIVSETAVPAGVTFAAYTEASPLSITDIVAGAAQRIWIKRVVDVDADNDPGDVGVISVEYA